MRWLIKKLVQFSMIAFVICILSACGPAQDFSRDESFETLTVAVRSGERNQLQHIANGFEEENPNIKLKFIELSSGVEQYRLISASISSDYYLFDVMEIEDVWVDDFTSKGYIQPLTENLFPGSDYLPYAKDCFLRDGRAYAIPFQMDVGMLFALKKYGWDGEFSSIAQLPRGSGDSELRIRDDDGEDTICCLMELIRYTDNNIPEALELYRRIYHSENSGRLYLEAFKNGEIPILRAPSRVIPTLRGETSSVAGEFQIYNTPKSGSELETSTAKIYGFAISKLSTQRQNCEKFIAYCDRSSVQRAWCIQTGVYPVRQELYRDPSILSEWNHISPMEQRIWQAQVRPYALGYVERENSIRDIMKTYLAGGLTTEEAAAHIEDFFQMGNGSS